MAVARRINRNMAGEGVIGSRGGISSIWRRGSVSVSVIIAQTKDGAWRNALAHHGQMAAKADEGSIMAKTIGNQTGVAAW